MGAGIEMLRPRLRLAVRRAAEVLPTPSILYDFTAIGDVVAAIRDDIAADKDARLNVALKACHTAGVLEFLSTLGLGCDCASVGELRLAEEARFDESSITGPAFSAEDFEEMRSRHVRPDLDSVSQVDLYGSLYANDKVGLRVRVVFPPELESSLVHGKDSRFGVVATDAELWSSLEKHDLEVTSLRAHTGETTFPQLLYKTKYLLRVAEAFPSVDVVNLGGGLSLICTSTGQARESFERILRLASDWRELHQRPLRLRLEPGSALLGSGGFLITEVRAVQWHAEHRMHVVTVDASAWNIAPWVRPDVHGVGLGQARRRSTLIAGNSCYEADYFGRLDNTIRSLEVPACEVGDRLIMTHFGAYAMTNARRFNGLVVPQEFALEGDCVRLLSRNVV